MELTHTPTGDTAMGCDNYGGQCISYVSSLGLRVLHYGIPLRSVIFDPGLLAQLTGCGDMVNMNAVESPNQVEFLTQDLLAYTKL
jgi:hypothetical protein